MPQEAFEKLSEEKKNLLLTVGIRLFSRGSYRDVSTDDITRQCRISKGLLFHYFGSKKNFYLVCLSTAMDKLTAGIEEPVGSDFYEILFESMDRKMAVCVMHRDEMLLVNMASRDPSGEIASEKEALLRSYRTVVQAGSELMLRKAMLTLRLREEAPILRTQTGLLLYTQAVLNRYLLRYQDSPMTFFEEADEIKAEIKEYLDLMLYGICGERK